MTTFEENYPSLKKRDVIIDISIEQGNGHKYITESIIGEEVFTKDIIEQFCLDKQKVREVIDKLTLTGYKGNPEGYINAKMLLEELGL